MRNDFSPEVSTQNGLSALPGRHDMLYQSGHKHKTDANSSFLPLEAVFELLQALDTHSKTTPKRQVTPKDALNYNLALYPRKTIE